MSRFEARSEDTMELGALLGAQLPLDLGALHCRIPCVPRDNRTPCQVAFQNWPPVTRAGKDNPANVDTERGDETRPAFSFMFTRPVDAAVCRETVNAGRKHVQPRAFSGKPGLSRHRHHLHHIYHPSPHHRHHHYPPSISGHCHQPCCSQFGNYPSVHVSDNNSSIFLAIYFVPIISTMEICCCKENGCFERLIVNCYFMERFIWHLA